MTAEQQLAESLGIGIQLRTTEVPGGMINYAVCGSGEPLLLLHGGTIGWGSWYANLARLAKNFTVYAIDLPGSGNSFRVDYTKPRFYKEIADTVASFIRANNLTQLHIAGHSFGGWVAMQIAAHHKDSVRKIVLVDSVGFSTHAAVPELLLSFYPLALLLSKTVLKPNRENAALEKLMLREAFYNTHLQLSGEFIEYVYENMGKSHNLPFISRLVRARKELYAQDVFSDVLCPTLILWGENDPILPLRFSSASFEKLRNAHVEIIAGSGHVPQTEQSQQCNTLMGEFLRA